MTPLGGHTLITQSECICPSLGDLSGFRGVGQAMGGMQRYGLVSASITTISHFDGYVRFQGWQAGMGPPTGMALAGAESVMGAS